jgi:hypothetical protein
VCGYLREIWEGFLSTQAMVVVGVQKGPPELSLALDGCSRVSSSAICLADHFRFLIVTGVAAFFLPFWAMSATTCARRSWAGRYLKQRAVAVGRSVDGQVSVDSFWS